VNYLRNDVSLKFIKTGVDFAIVQCFGTFPDGLEQQRLRVEFGVDA